MAKICKQCCRHDSETHIRLQDPLMVQEMMGMKENALPKH